MTGRPFQIGSVGLKTNLLLAPIAGYCDLAFRTVCREPSTCRPCIPFPVTITRVIVAPLTGPSAPIVMPSF